MSLWASQSEYTFMNKTSFFARLFSTLLKHRPSKISDFLEEFHYKGVGKHPSTQLAPKCHTRNWESDNWACAD
ncbi:hypothetical protein C2G38_2155077 [Gigaspora rosea]|uniref:Uncharacterized protein n=1 Tax=Gigaspora rosea TaxID=44941 RepID=A0A397WC50_9GLOM|nr:hypothetical protein C2G38_2155077 [Gigaspora rosea]